MDDFCGRRLDLLHRHLCPHDPPALPPHMVTRPCSQRSSLGGPVVVGAMVLDIHASPSSNALLPGTTTPGKVLYNRGGVGRNVAECMSKLGMVPFLISVIGQDMAGDILLAHWQSLDLLTDGIRQCPGITTPVVSAIFDGKGELAGAVADTSVVEEYLTPEWIVQFENAIQSADFLLLDANLNAAALEAACKLAKGANVPIWFEPVSVSKSLRYAAISNNINYVSPNEAELVAMANGNTNTEEVLSVGVLKNDDRQISIHALIQHLEKHILVLLQKGVTYVVLTLGRHGVVLCSEVCNLENSCNWDWRTLARNDFGHFSRKARQNYSDGGFKLFSGQDLQVGTCDASGIQSSNDSNSCFRPIDVCYVHFPALPASVVSASGAGDCFVAGALTALCLRKGVYSSMAYGIAVATEAIQSELNVPSDLSLNDLIVDAKSVLDSAEHIVLS